MGTVSKLLLLLFCSHYSLVAAAGDSPSYIAGALNTEAVCSETKGSVYMLSKHAIHTLK
jgi:hypothetical protein